MTSQPGSQTIKIYTFPNISRSIGKQTMKSDKNLNILKRKRAFKVKLKAFFIIFKEDFQLPKIVSDLRVRLSGRQ